MRYALILAAVLQAFPAVAGTPGAEAFDQAYETIRAGRPLQALPLYERAIAEAPDHEGAWMEYAVCLRRLGRLAAAARAGWRALELGEPSAGKWANLGNVFVQAHAFDAARAAFEEAARLGDDGAWAARNFLNLGYREWAAGLGRAAADDYLRASKLDPGNPLAAVDLALLIASDDDRAKVAAGKAALEKVRERLEPADERTARYVDAALGEIRSKGKVTAPHFPDLSAQELPRALLVRPAKGTAAALPLPARSWRTYQLRRDLAVRLEVPEGWGELVQQSDPRVLAIRFQPSGGSPRKMLVTVLAHPAQSTAQEVRAFMEEQLKPLLAKAVEKAPALVDISSPTTHAFAFSVTDRDALKRPTLDDAPYLTQGHISGKRVDLVFSYFAIADVEQERKEAVAAMRGVEEVP